MDAIKNQDKFLWTEETETEYLREIYFLKPYQHVPGSKGGVGAWKSVEQALNDNYGGKYEVLSRKQLQDKLRTTLQNRETVVRQLAKESGIVETETELTKLKDDIIAERNHYLEQQKAEKEGKKTDDDKEKEAAADTRLKAMERCGQSKKRAKTSDDEQSPSSKRNTGNDTITYMEKRSKGKAEERRLEREEDMKLRQKDLEMKNKQSEATSNAMLEMMKMMQEQQQQQFQLFNSMLDKLKKD